ncbi:MAG: PAS domain-containing protein, partial [Alphaproteobacteria bacterium]|nr:PAS domain-containing protein [Alphaproteobacteria bacterium]
NRAEFSAILQGLFSTPEIVELTLETVAPGQRTLQADMLLLPMKNDQGEISRILGCLVANGAPSNPPHRFSITSHKVTRIVASDFQPKRTRTAGFAEAARRFTAKPARREAASHLTLVVSDD